MSESRAWTRPRFLLALLLAVLVAEAVPAPTAATRRDKGSAAAAWRASAARPAEQGGDPDPGGTSLFTPLSPASFSVPLAVAEDADATRTPPSSMAAPAAGRLPLPRAPPIA